MSTAYRSRPQLKDVWEAAKTERNFDYVFWLHTTLDILAELAFRHFGYCLVLLAVVLITVLVAAGFLIVLPVVMTPGSVWSLINHCFGTRRPCPRFALLLVSCAF